MKISVLTASTAAALASLTAGPLHADLVNYAAAGTDSFDVFDSDDKFDGTENGAGPW